MKISAHDTEARVIECVENALNELEALTMSRDGAVRLLLIQSAIEMPDARSIRQTLSHLLVDTID